MTCVPAEAGRNTSTVMESEQVKHELFASKVKNIFGSKAEEILDAISRRRYETFRINSHKLGISETLEALRVLGFEIKEGAVPGSFINLSSLKGLKISQTALFKKGVLYVQGLSSMLDVVVLGSKPDDKIMDLCASPGSKTSFMASLTGVPKNIYAVESNSARFYSMKKNLALQGYSDVVTVKANAVGLLNRYPGFREAFDRVLVDVPCSNEGNIRLSVPDPLKFWNPKLPKKISMLQKKILASGYSMLKPGGYMVYSTCTYSFEENESVVNWALKKFPDLDVMKINNGVKDLRYLKGLTEYKGEKTDPRISNTVRILPNDYFDGFFISLLWRRPVGAR